MAFTLKDKFQRGLNFAIVDEVDSILIDEARTPLIISGPAEESTDLYHKINLLAPKLKRQVGTEDEPDGITEEGDFIVDEKNRQIELTERGHAFVEDELVRVGLLTEGDSLYAATNLGLLHHVHAALRAHNLFKRDVDYMVQNDEIVIVDEHTGRAMPGRRWSEGLHQAIEAKEAVSIQNETQTLASTTFQNYFRMYNKLVRDDRDGGYRSVRVPPDLWACSGRHPDPPADGAQRRQRSRVPDDRREVRGDRRRHQPTHCGGSPGTRRHRVDRIVRTTLGRTRQAQDSAQRAEREATRARGGDHRAGRSARRRHDCNEHGRSRDRHRARRQLASRSRGARGSDAGADRADTGTVAAAPRRRRHRRRLAHRRHRTSRIASHRQPVARARRSPGRQWIVAVLPVDGRQSDADIRVGSNTRHHAVVGTGEGRSHRASHGHQRDREGAAQGRRPQLRHSQESARIRRCFERSAAGDLSATRRADGVRRHLGDDQRVARGSRRQRHQRVHPGAESRRAMGHCRARAGVAGGLQRESSDSALAR